MNSVTCDLTISLDGYLAGPNQSPSNPLGEGGEDLHRWMFEEPQAHAAVIEGILSSRAFIMGRNMFAGPGEGIWDEDWRGWWGENPPYHAPVFVLTHHPSPRCRCRAAQRSISCPTGSSRRWIRRGRPQPAGA